MQSQKFWSGKLKASLALFFAETTERLCGLTKTG
jgi:hypothetical protein